MVIDKGNQERIPESLADEPTRRKLAKARKRTRSSLSRKLKVTPETVRRTVKRSDLYFSTLRNYVKRRGGNLWLEVSFPDRPPVFLAGLGENAGEDEGEKKAKKKAGAPAKSKARTRRAA
jgi:hypothetical protein